MAEHPKDKSLPPKQARFVELYLVYLNATRAYQEAYGCSEKVARASGARLLANVRVAAVIAASVEVRAKAAGMDADEVLNRIAHIGRVDIADLFDDNNCLKDIRDMPLEARLSIASVEVDELWEGKGDDRQQIGVTKKIRFWDKRASLETLGKHHKLFTEKRELEVGESLAALIAEAAKK